MPLDVQAIAAKAAAGAKLNRQEEIALHEANAAEVFRSLSQKSLCAALSTTPRSVLQWESDGMPRNADRSYDLPTVIGWLKRRWRQAAEIKLAHRKRFLSDIEARRKTEMANKLARENAVAVGLLVKRAAVCEMLTEETLMFREGLRDMDARLAPLLVNKAKAEEVQGVLEKEHRELCERWAKACEKYQ